MKNKPRNVVYRIQSLEGKVSAEVWADYEAKGTKWNLLWKEEGDTNFFFHGNVTIEDMKDRLSPKQFQNWRMGKATEFIVERTRNWAKQKMFYANQKKAKLITQTNDALKPTNKVVAFFDEHIEEVRFRQIVLFVDTRVPGQETTEAKMRISLSDVGDLKTFTDLWNTKGVAAAVKETRNFGVGRPNKGLVQPVGPRHVGEYYFALDAELTIKNLDPNGWQKDHIIFRMMGPETRITVLKPMDGYKHTISDSIAKMVENSADGHFADYLEAKTHWRPGR